MSHTVPRVSDIAPALPYAVFLQNTLILCDVVPRAMPWAGMRCPFGANETAAVAIQSDHRICKPLPQRGIACHWVGVAGLGPIE